MDCLLREINGTRIQTGTKYRNTVCGGNQISGCQSCSYSDVDISNLNAGR